MSDVMDTPPEQGTIDLGWFQDKNGKRGLLTWNPADGTLVYNHPDGVEEIGTVISREKLRERLDGWPEQAIRGAGIDWVREKFERSMEPCPKCGGTGWRESSVIAGIPELCDCGASW